MPKICLTKNSAMVLKRKKPFYNWLQDADKRAHSSDNITYKDDNSTYIIPVFDKPKDFREFLKTNYLAFFKNELNEWHKPEFFPENLSWQLFCDFFDADYNTQVYEVVV